MIIFKEKPSKREEIRFKSLGVTDTFLVDYFDKDEIFMRAGEYDPDINAFSLKKGTFHRFDDNQNVKPVDLVIEYSVKE
jgi:hypothetical protein